MTKRIMKITSALLGILLTSSVFAQTAGTLTFNFTEVSKATNQTYQSTGQHVLAVWIQSSTGTFTKSRLRYVANGTNDHLPTWAANASCPGGNAASNSCNKVGATTGASLSSFAARSFTWDGTDATAVVGALVPDGSYKVTIEQTWNHGTTGTVVRSFTFTKGPNSDIQTPTTDANFSGISLQWIPAAVAPTASFTQSATSVCAGQTVTFTSTSTGAPTSYAWTIQGGTPATSTAQNPTVTFATAGTYSVSFTATNTTGSSSPVSHNVVVNAIPTITNTTPATRCGDGTVTLGATASAGTISWFAAATGGTALGTGTTFTTPTLTANTTYYVSSTANGCTTASRTAVLATVNPGPTVTTTPSNHCGAGTVTLGATTSAGTISWYATATGGSALGTGTSFTTPTITSNTTYYVEVVSGSCTTSRVPVLATIDALPTVTNPGNSTACVGFPSNAVTFSGTNGSTFAWTNDNTATGLAANGTGNIAAFTPTAAGTSTVSVSAYLNGCLGNPTTFTITANPVPTVTLGTFNNVCVNNPSFALTGGSPVGGTYAGNGVTNNNFSPAAAGAGTITITYYVTQNGCTNQTTSTIVVDACAGIKETVLESIHVYPNPTTGIVTIESDKMNKFTSVQLIDLNGKTIGTWELKGNKTVLDFTEQVGGIYNLKMTGEGTEAIKRIQIKK
jgi:hypothetical protein